jgi:beta-galactosidase
MIHQTDLRRPAWTTASAFLALFCLSLHALASDFNADWRFTRADIPNADRPGFDDTNWDLVTLPHTARVEALVTGEEDNQWQGVCWYRKTFTLPSEAKNKRILLRFEGAMNQADIWVNGERAGRFMGGYLPYVMDISDRAQPGQRNVVAIRLDNRDNPITGPKPLKDLDFNLYSGLYRPAQLVIQDKLHITDPLLENKAGGGGVFVTFPEATGERATVRVQTHFRNGHETERTAGIRTTLIDPEGQPLATVTTEPARLSPGADQTVVQEIGVSDPRLWSPDSPELYTVRSELMHNGKIVDTEETQVGIRRIRITRNGFWINGEKSFLRGANRHQEYPYIGNALSDAAQYRDARKIKEAGFDYVRLSHYPQSPAFMDACDELGLVVMNCIMGWQFFNKDPAFAKLKYEECRQLIRRDRNHPCVILWEVSLNESHMPKEFIHKTHAIAHEEYPGDQCYSCGWTDGYDVFIQARQHGGCRGVTNRPCLVSEYGDWEYFAQNAGLNQHLWNDLQPAERNSRQLRGAGEVRLLQQAMNFQEAHNDNRKTTAFADGIWVMYDYNRGYADDIEASGVMDIFRLPKFGYWFFRSQREPSETVLGKPAGAMVFIANYWQPASPREIRVFSNCDEIELRLNGRTLERRRPDDNRWTSHLVNPPFTFQVDSFEPGRLEAIGYTNGHVAASHTRHTPGRPESLRLRFDLSGRSLGTSMSDTIFCYADLVDANGQTVPDAEVPVTFAASGSLDPVGHNPILSEAGTATVLLQNGVQGGHGHAYALCINTDGQTARILAAAGNPHGGHANDYVVRYTTDGSEPTVTSNLYDGSALDAERLRAALFVNGKRLASADTSRAAPSTR